MHDEAQCDNGDGANLATSGDWYSSVSSPRVGCRVSGAHQVSGRVFGGGDRVQFGASDNLPREYIAQHIDPDAIGEVEAWVTLATEYVQLRCQWLRDEAKAAVHLNAKVLIDPLTIVLPGRPRPGEWR